MSCPYCRREGATSPSSDAAAPAPDLPQASPTTPALPPPNLAASATPSSNPGNPPRKPFHRARKTGWLFPGILLVVMPKCPLCLAAYIALFTGISIPITAATRLRWALIAGCVGALAVLGVRTSLYLYKRLVR